MKKAVLFLTWSIGLSSLALLAHAQEKHPEGEKKIRITVTDGEDKPLVYEFNSLEEMLADERLKEKGLPLLFKDQEAFRIKAEAHRQQAAVLRQEAEKLRHQFSEADVSFRWLADSALEKLERSQLEQSGKHLDNVRMMFYKEKQLADSSGRILRRQVVRTVEVPEHMRKMLQEQGIAIEAGEQLVILQGLPPIPEPPLPPLPPAPEAAPLPGDHAPAAPALAPLPPVEPEGWLEVLKIYPNPSEGQFKLQFKADASGPAVVRLLDLNGKVIYEEEIPDAGILIQKTISLSAGTKGMHLLQIEQGGRKFSERVLLK